MSGVLIPIGVLLVLVMLIKGCPMIFPKGFPSGSRGSYQGIVSIPKEGWDFALFTSSDLLEENERLRGSGRQLSSITCLEPSSAARVLESAAAEAASDANGNRDLWVNVQATPRIATGPCMKKFSAHSNRVPYGTYLEIKAVMIARPLGCSYLQYVVNHLRCP